MALLGARLYAAGLIAVATGAAFVGAAALHRRFDQLAAANSERIALQIAATLEQRVQRSLSEAERLASLARLAALQEPQGGGATWPHGGSLGFVLDALGEIGASGMSVITPSRVLAYGDLPHRPYAFNDAGPLATDMAFQTAITVLRSRAGDDPVLRLSYGPAGPEGLRRSRADLFLPARALLSPLLELLPGRDASLFLLDRDGATLAAAIAGHAGSERPVLPAGHPLLAVLSSDAPGVLRAGLPAEPAGELVAYRGIPDTPFVIALGLSETSALAGSGFRRALNAALAAMVLLPGAAGAALLLAWQRRRMRAKLETMRREREGALLGLAESQRLEALGRIASGVAHDFSNALQALSNYLELILSEPRLAKKVKHHALLAARTVARGTSITRRLLELTRREEEPQATDVTALLEELSEILRDTLGAGFLVRTHASLDLPPVLADRGDLEAVLVNLATNARDAMMPMGGGTVTLSAVAEEFEAEPMRPGPGPGSYIRIDVGDTGVGMDAETLAHASELFFTTKAPGAGTGLGLAMAREFAERLGGALHIASAVGLGTTVTLWLPQARRLLTPAPGDAAGEPAILRLEANPGG